METRVRTLEDIVRLSEVYVSAAQLVAAGLLTRGAVLNPRDADLPIAVVTDGYSRLGRRPRNRRDAYLRSSQAGANR